MIPASSGVYQIRCKRSRKVYIGKSLNMRKRRNQHLSLLRSNNHYNNHLQAAFNLYGEKSFSFKVIELCDESELEEKEQLWITNKKASDNRYGYNCSETSNPGQSEAFTKPKEYIVTSPEGIDVHVKNLTKFCRDMGWTHPDSRLHKIARGKQNSYLGYTCRYATQTKEQWEATRIRFDKPGQQPRFYVYAIHPCGKEERVDDLKAFCQLHNLSKGNVWECMAKSPIRKQHKGFTFKKFSVCT